MKYVIYGLLAAFLATWAYGAIPSTAEGWYTPANNNWNTVGANATYEIKGRLYGCMINGDGEITWGIEPNDQTVKFALENALKAKWSSSRNDQKIEEIGKNLDNLVSLNRIRVQNPQTGQSYVLDFGGSIASGSGGEITATSSEESFLDGRSLDWSNNYAELKGWSNSSANVDSWGQFASPVNIPVRSSPSAALSYMNWYGVDRLSLQPNSSHKLELAGWRDSRASMTPLAEAIAKKEKGVFENYELVVRNASKGVNYVSLGTLDSGGAPVDDVSIVTNTADGAISQGVASLSGWNNANVNDLPQKGEGRLKWTPPADMVDGVSLGVTESGAGNVWEVKGAHVYAGAHAGHYFGTHKDSAQIGWFELPNATTNRVEGDERSISSTTDPGRPDVKIFGLRGWSPRASGNPWFLVNRNGYLDYVQMATNSLDTALWEQWFDWLGAGELSDGTPPVMSFGGFSTFYSYLYAHNGLSAVGIVGRSDSGNDCFEYTANGITATFNAPVTWADDSSIVVDANGKYGLSGWDNASSCSANISDMLQDPDSADAKSHKLLAYKNGDLHYVPMGDGVNAPDELSIVLSEVSGLDGKRLMVNGFDSASAGAIPYKSAAQGGGIAWVGASSAEPSLAVLSSGSNVSVDQLGKSLEDKNRVINLSGYDTAKSGQVPAKPDSGDGLVWSSPILGIASNLTITVVTSVEWTGAPDYQLVAKRGNLALDQNGKLYIKEESSLKQIINTTPLSSN